MRRTVYLAILLACPLLLCSCVSRSQVSDSTTRIRSPDSMSDAAKKHDGPYNDTALYLRADPP
jgi:hypothetical protein